MLGRKWVGGEGDGLEGEWHSVRAGMKSGGRLRAGLKRMIPGRARRRRRRG